MRSIVRYVYDHSAYLCLLCFTYIMRILSEFQQARRRERARNMWAKYLVPDSESIMFATLSVRQNRKF